MTYDNAFFDYIDDRALRSGRVVVDLLYPLLRPRAVLDVGCGRGGWLRIWKDAGCPIVHGVDGSYVDRQLLSVDANEFDAADLSRPLDLGRRFDLVQCLEVAEHVPPASSGILIDNLIRHGDVILFSAAPPGQGGTHHINERPVEYWRGLFRERGYGAYDWLRPLIFRNAGVEPFYRYNTLLYVSAAAATSLPAEIMTTRVADLRPLREYASWQWRLRRLLLRNLPAAVVDRAAAMNARMHRPRSKSRAEP